MNETLPEYFLSREPRKGLGTALFLILFLLWVFIAGCFLQSAMNLITHPSLFDAIFAPACFLLLKLLRFKALFERADQLSTPGARTVLSSRKRKPVLFLRSFNEEFAEVPYEGTRYEECFARAFEIIGPLVAVGRPGEELPTPGAARFYLKNEDWQPGVWHMLHRAQAVVLQIGSSSGLAWEIETVLREVHPERLLLYFPLGGRTRRSGLLGMIDRIFLESPKSANLPPDTNESMHRRKQSHWEHFVNQFGPLIPKPLPPELGDAIFVCFDSEWNPTLLKLLSTREARSDHDDPSQRVSESLRPFLDRFETEPLDEAFKRTCFLPIISLLLGMPFLLGSGFFYLWLKRALSS